MKSRIARLLLRSTHATAILAAAAAPIAAQAPAFKPDVAVIQVNDIYRIDGVANGTAGGLGRVATLIGRARRDAGGAPVQIVHSGDFIAPSLESRYFGGLQMIDAMNFLNARAPLTAIPGNHEFDERQPAMLAAALKASAFPWLAGNVAVRTGDADADRRMGRDTVVTWGGMRVGIFTLSFLDSPRSYAVDDTAVVASAERQIRELEARGVDALVGITHLEMAHDRQIARLRRTHPRLVWIAGGHEHFLQREALTDSTSLITKGDSNARRVWEVFLARGPQGPRIEARAVAMDSTVAVDPAYTRDVLQKWAGRVRDKVPYFDQRIGTSSVMLDAREETVRDAESNWGSWLADQMRGAFPDVRADVAVLNGGAIRIDDQFSGPIRWEHLARTFGFPTRVGLVWLRGRDLRQLVLEQSVSGGRGEGRFLQVSGLKFRFDRSLPVGKRVLDVQMQNGTGWVPLDEARIYVVAVPDYMYGGGDGYGFKNAATMTIPPGPDVKYLAFDALGAAYARGEPIAPRVEGRIVEVTH
ncbi:MAG TPA: 5'-nucleotidase C-terminal domain-containing protein [Longimicrobiaceae bacterium]|nr:5'-nucleotidase C-terminal domain-containing protein [Longimicrobiaceae bacterium]